MKIELLEPAELDGDALPDVLAIVGVTIRPEEIARWTRLERALAYDWAMREHLHASDNPVRRRDKPSFVAAAEVK